MPAGLREGRSLQRGVRLLGGYHGGGLSLGRPWPKLLEGPAPLGSQKTEACAFSSEAGRSASGDSDGARPRLVQRKSLIWAASAALAASAAGAAIVLASEQSARGSSSSEAGGQLQDALVGFKEFAAELAESSAHKASSAAQHASLALAHASEAVHATAVLLQCLASVLVADHDAGLQARDGWWAPQVTATVADLAANERRRKAIARAGSGKVVKWLLCSVSGGNESVQREAARAVAWLLSDDTTSRAVLAQEGGVRHLLEFAASLDQRREGPSDAESNPLVDAIMELVTSSPPASARALLAEAAAPEDIAAALAVLREGSMDSGEEAQQSAPGGAERHRNGAHGSGGDRQAGTGEVSQKRMVDSGATLATGGLAAGMRGLAAMQGSEFRVVSCEPARPDRPLVLPAPEQRRPGGTGMRQGGRAAKRGDRGLWDDLSGSSVAVMLAAWALATWTQASAANRAKIAELDRDGTALSVGALAPERSVRLHVASAASELLREGPGGAAEWAEAVGECWSGPLLGAAVSAGQQHDSELACRVLDALAACVASSCSAQALVAQTGLGALRELARQHEDDALLQAALAHTLQAVASRAAGLPAAEGKQWAPVLLGWACAAASPRATREAATEVLEGLLGRLGRSGVAITQGWLAMLLMALVAEAGARGPEAGAPAASPGRPSKRGVVQGQIVQEAAVATAQLARVVAREAAAAARHEAQGHATADLLGTGGVQPLEVEKEAAKKARVGASEALAAVARAVKAMTELAAEQPAVQERILEAGGLPLLRHLLLGEEYEAWLAEEEREGRGSPAKAAAAPKAPGPMGGSPAHMRKHALRLLKLLAAHEATWPVLANDPDWIQWLERCADGQVASNEDAKSRSYARITLLHAAPYQHLGAQAASAGSSGQQSKQTARGSWPRYEDCILLMDPGHPSLRQQSLHSARDGPAGQGSSSGGGGVSAAEETEEPPPGAAGCATESAPSGAKEPSSAAERDALPPRQTGADWETAPEAGLQQGQAAGPEREEGPGGQAWQAGQEPVLDVVFVHGLCGGPYKTWRLADNPRSTVTAGGLLELADQDGGIPGSCWPGQWLSEDVPAVRAITVKYKTNLSEWKGATLPLQELSGMLLEKLWAAGVGQRPVVFICHSMGGLIVKQILAYAQEDPRYAPLLDHTRGAVFYSTPHWGSRLADMPWRMGLVLRPAPSVEDLRSTSPRLDELNRTLRKLHQKGQLAVLSFSETLLSPVVKAYGGIALRMEVVPIESAYPGFGDIVVLDGTDHVNSCKPKDRSDIIYTRTLELLRSVEASVLREQREQAPACTSGSSIHGQSR